MIIIGTLVDHGPISPRAKEVVILGLGISERGEISDDFLEREAHDRDSIDLPNVQMLGCAGARGNGEDAKRGYNLIYIYLSFFLSIFLHIDIYLSI